MGENSQKNFAMADIFGNSAAGALGMVGAYRDSKARKSAAEKRAEQAARKGEDEVRIAGIRTGRLFGSQRAAFAANGIDIAGSVTARDILADTSEEGVREAVQIRRNASEEAAGYRAEAASESPMMAALGIGLGAAGTVAAKWYNYGKVGVYGGSVLKPLPTPPGKSSGRNRTGI